MIVRIEPSKIIVDSRIQKLCITPYYNHKNGCPNYNKKKGCPPNQPLINDVLDFNKEILLIYTEFDIKSHVEKMKEKHPNWSERQLYCCLYWQPKARKIHKHEIKLAIISETKIVKVVSCPEAHGVSVTETMRNIGVELEWLPKNIARIVSLGGKLSAKGGKG